MELLELREKNDCIATVHMHINIKQAFKSQPKIHETQENYEQS